MNLLQQKEYDFKITIGLVISFFAFLGLTTVHHLITSDDISIILIIFGMISSLLAYGLFFLKEQTLVFTQFILYTALIVSIFGFINPFMAMDIMAQGLEPPSTKIILIGLAPYVIGILWCLHILGKYKQRFT